MSICQPNTIYWEMLDGARDLIQRYFDADERNIDQFVVELSDWIDRYSIESSVKKYPAIKDNKDQYRKAQILDIWMYRLTYAMQEAIDDVSGNRLRNPKEI